MRIVVNTRLLRKDRLDGIGWFAFNTLKLIVEKNPQVEFHFLFDSGIESEFLFGENVIGHNLFPPAKHAMLNILWSEVFVKRKLRYLNPDLYYSPDGMLCLGWNGKQHGVIHDLNFMHYPEHLKWTNRKYYRSFFPQFAKKATRIATVSEYSKIDIVKSFGISPDKIDVVYCGINSFLRPLSEEEKYQVREKFTDSKPFFLFVGTLSPRKNVIGLLKAYDLFKNLSQSDIKLVVVGGGMYKTEETHAFLESMTYRKDVLFTGRLADDDLRNIYGAALALTYLPYFEGFGIPLIEAMQTEIPIISSNVTSLPEVTGDAALLVNPNNTEEIIDAMSEISSNENLRNEMIAKGKRRKEIFSWQRTSDLLWQSISHCL
ncbi:MAG TPA: glycosyltransferase family 1 protein [Chitinophagaceae bacterium]|jgi:glycosyltransferase involved in cell wall biosynthesis|nr:glycosyltransferase family 1 protein [Chitinophagaceae bacterium]